MFLLCSSVITELDITNLTKPHLIYFFKPMNNPSSPPTANVTAPPEATAHKDSYVKLAMRNMVRKGGQSLRHFFLTTVGLLALLIGLAYLTKP